MVAINQGLGDNLNVRVGAAWTHAREVDFENAVGTQLVAATQTNRTGQVEDWSGQQMARAPNRPVNVGFDYGLDLAGERLSVAGNGYFIASYVIQNPSLFGATAGPELANKRRYRQPSYAIFSSQLNRTAPGGHYTIGVYAENLTDKRYTIIRSGGAFGDYSQYNEPRTHGIRAGFKY